MDFSLPLIFFQKGRPLALSLVHITVFESATRVQKSFLGTRLKIFFFFFNANSNVCLLKV